MLPYVLGAVALGLLATACKNSKEENPKPAPEESLPENKVPFFKISQNAYWADLDVDGKVQDRETIFDRNGNERLELAQKLIDSNSWAFSPCYRWRPKFVNLTKSEAYSHPLKTRLETQIRSDLEKLKQLKDPPALYDKLTEDLEIILKELPHVLFRFPTDEETKEFSTNAGYLGLYNYETNEIVAPGKMPISLLIHEMDHRVTEHYRTAPWSTSYREKCPDEKIRDVPKAPHLPSPDQEKHSFEFSLDFFGIGQNHLHYDGVAAWQPFYRSIELGALACYPESAKESTLANEVRAYQTMGRYLLFRTGLKQKDLNAIRGEDLKIKDAVKEKLLRGLVDELSGSSLNPVWTYHMMLHYLGVGGETGKENLPTFVKDYYSQVIKDPGFVDPPDCQ